MWLRQVGRQQAGRAADGDCPVRGVASPQLLPAGTLVCGLDLGLELGIHHTESWSAYSGKQNEWLLVGKQVDRWSKRRGRATLT